MTPGNGQISVLYIGGAGRSGSTLLDMLLGNTTSFFSVGEVRFFWEYMAQDDLLCGCGDSLRKCNFWSTVYASLVEQGMDIPRLASISNRLNRTRNAFWMSGNINPKVIPGFSELIDATAQLYRLILAHSGASVIVDSSKVPSHFAILRRIEEIDLKLIHLIRDGRAVAYSWHKRPKKELAKVNIQATMPHHSLWRSIITWAVENNSTANVARLVPYTQMKYEDFTHAPYKELERALTELGISANLERLQNPDLILEPTHSVGGNPMRFAARQILVKPDVEWRDKMPASVRMALWLLAMPLMVRYGYKM